VLANPSPQRLSLTSSGCQNFPPKISLEPATSSTSPEPMPSLTPPWSLRPLIESSQQPPHRRSQPRSSPFTSRHQPRSRRPQAHDVILEPTTTLSSPSPWCCAPDAVSEPATPSTHTVLGPSVSLSSLSPRRPRAHDAVKLMPSLSPLRHHSPQARKATILYIFLCHFGPTNPDFDMLHCHIALICYIAFVLLHYYDVLHCHIALICHITFNMLHCFDLLHCHIALICYIAFDMLHCFDILHCFCFVALLWYATLQHCFDMLHIAILLLFCYIMIYMNAYYIAPWRKWTKWDECGNMDQHYYTIKISASNNK
jgi:hypothetical protein